MAPLVVQLIAWGIAWSAGAADLVPVLAAPVEALRVALAVMFVFTAVAHFVPRTRADMLAMVPSALPMPGALVTVTGVLELVGAVGLILPRWNRWAALALAALLIAMFPANIHAARTGITIAGRRAMAVLPRLALQLFWIGCLLWVALESGGGRAP